jgi:hypothetical protein
VNNRPIGKRPLGNQTNREEKNKTKKIITQGEAHPTKHRTRK